MYKYLVLLLLALISCSPNQKYFKYDYVEEKINKIKTVVITPIEMIWEKPKGTDYKSIAKLETLIENYVKENGFSIQSNETLADNWKIESEKAGGFFNPTTGKIDSEKIGICLIKAITATREKQDFDAVIFIKLIKRTAKLTGDRAYWDGCARKILDDNGDVITDVKWQGHITGLSIQIQIFDRNHHLAFQSIGAIEFPYVLSKSYTKSELIWKNPLEFKTDELNEGIGVAFHPFISYMKYPDKPNYYEK